MSKRTDHRVGRVSPIPLILLILGTSAFGRVLYVDDDANGLNDGSSWVNACKYLQDALVDANSVEKPVEIRVAQGIYKPDRNSAEANGTGNRKATFQLINGVTIMGGYAGFGASDPNERDIVKYETILSGDLGGNDIEVKDPSGLLHEPTRSENSFHVVAGSGTCNTALLDGFTVCAGNAYETPWHPLGFNNNNRGGAMYNLGGSPALIDSTFSSNTAEECGGAIYNCGGSNPLLINCTFNANAVVRFGGGIYNRDNSEPKLVNCSFRRNLSVGWSGGAIYNADSSPILTNCNFSGNVAYYGGALYNAGSNAKITACSFTGNWARAEGGGVYNWKSSPEFVTCTLNANTAEVQGGGMVNEEFSNPTITTCTIANNKANRGGGMYSYLSGPLISGCIFIGNFALSKGGGVYYGYVENPKAIANSTFVANSAINGRGLAYDGYNNEYVISDCIVRNGGNEIWYDNTTVTVRYSNVEGSWPGTGNIDADPCFANPGYRDTNGTPEDPNDDFWIDGDYHLKSQAGRWDPATQSWVKDDVTSPCIDAGDPASPIGLEQFPNGGRINMGAYGGTVEASKSYFGEPPCETIIAGDINGDCKVDLADLTILAQHWLDERR